MRIRLHCPLLIVLAVALAVISAPLARADTGKGGISIPVTHYKLPNGLKVVLSPDSTAPTVVVAVYYNVGFRIEPRDRTGFAHLFEHLLPEKMTIAVVGDRAKIAEQLNEFGKGTDK